VRIQVVNVILEVWLGASEFINFLVSGEINFLFDAIDRIIQLVIFVEHFPEMVIRPLRRRISRDARETLSYGVVKVHNVALLTAK